MKISAPRFGGADYIVICEKCRTLSMLTLDGDVAECAGCGIRQGAEEIKREYKMRMGDQIKDWHPVTGGDNDR